MSVRMPECSGFGIDSFVESASGLVMICRLQAERRASRDDALIDAIEHRARRMVALSLLLLAAFFVFDAGHTLWAGEHPAFSLVGVVLTSISLVVMLWLARAKRRVARPSAARPWKPMRSRPPLAGGSPWQRSLASRSTGRSAGGGPIPPPRSSSQP